MCGLVYYVVVVCCCYTGNRRSIDHCTTMLSSHSLLYYGSDNDDDDMDGPTASSSAIAQGSVMEPQSATSNADGLNEPIFPPATPLGSSHDNIVDLCTDDESDQPQPSTSLNLLDLLYAIDKNLKPSKQTKTAVATESSHDDVPNLTMDDQSQESKDIDMCDSLDKYSMLSTSASMQPVAVSPQTAAFIGFTERRAKNSIKRLNKFKKCLSFSDKSLPK